MTLIKNLTTGVRWSSDDLTLDSIRTGTFGTLTTTLGSAPLGTATVSVAGGSQIASSPFTAATMFFTATRAGGTEIEFTDIDIRGAPGNDMRWRLQPRGAYACVSQHGMWGDANNDNITNVVDAQQIARRSVDLSVASVTALDERGDVNEDGTVNIVDAQQIARYSIGLPASPRVNTAVDAPLAVESVSVQVGTASVGPGEDLALVASVHGAGGEMPRGCPAIVWTSSNAAVATVNESGVVRGVSPGATTITATVGGKSTQVAMQVTTTSVSVAGTRLDGSTEETTDLHGNVLISARATGGRGAEFVSVPSLAVPQ